MRLLIILLLLPAQILAPIVGSVKHAAGGVTKPASGAVINGTSLASGIVYCSPMNEGSGTTLADLTSSHSTGTFGASGSAPSWVNDSAEFQPGVAFAGGQNVSVANNSGLGTMTGMSMMVITKITSTGTYPMMFTTGSNTNLEIRLESTTQDLDAIVATTSNLTSGKTYADSTVHIFIVTFSSTAGHGTNVYVDGLSVLADTTNTGAPTLNQTNWFLGARDGSDSNPLTGRLYTVVLWNRELSSSDVTSLQSDPWSYLR